ncbi:hypothetical protein N7G274_007813 [Stereocaulon virgatum]|uniref:SNF2 N-terminal domain-containing protein n=1 Tax=Stereocaulon virgatum TaxID=373712 RepID=A0ABR4A3K7_9LECA
MHKPRATLAVIPGTLVHQWKAEIKRFIGRRFTVLTLSCNNDLKAMSVKKFKGADTIIVSLAMFETDTYLERVALFAALPEISTISRRRFSTWLSRANSRIEELTKELQNLSSFEEVDDTIAAEIAKEIAEETVLRIPNSPKKTNLMRPLSKAMMKLRS